MRRGKTGATFLERSRGRFHRGKHTKGRGVDGNTFTAVFANRTVTDCRATASVARQAKRLPYKFVEASLRAFFEGGGFAAEVRQNFAGEMQ